jgi:hypothetical protein
VTTPSSETASTSVSERTTAPRDCAAASIAPTAASASTQPPPGVNRTSPSKRMPGQRSDAAAADSQSKATSCRDSASAIAASSEGSPWSTAPVSAKTPSGSHSSRARSASDT